MDIPHKFYRVTLPWVGEGQKCSWAILVTSLKEKMVKYF